MSRVIFVRQSPKNERQWFLSLDCGHIAEVETTSKAKSPGKPTRRIHACEVCFWQRQEWHSK